MRYRAAPAEAVAAVELDTFLAVHHRPSGITHLLTSPAPEILAALAEPHDLDGLIAILEADYDLDDADRSVLAARLDELVAAGLVAAL